MGNAIWLFLAVPTWYFAAILTPFSEGELSAIPAFGVLCFIIGVVLGFSRRRKDLLVFLVLILVSQLLVVMAGLMRGSLRAGVTLDLLLLVFLLPQIAASAYLVWRLKGSRWPAAALAGFTSTYALFAAFVAEMAFRDVWL